MGTEVSLRVIGSHSYHLLCVLLSCNLYMYPFIVSTFQHSYIFSSVNSSLDFGVGYPVCIPHIIYAPYLRSLGRL